ncbi:MAG: hypothetical protein J0M18_09355 [Ignavibacteria bacterium]|nr:hypothetical protein [Ignavibacteria bacterium]
MKQFKTIVLSNLIFRNFMSVYWAMYYLEKLGNKKRNEKKTNTDKKEKSLKLIIKDKPVSEKKKIK